MRRIAIYRLPACLLESDRTLQVGGEPPQGLSKSSRCPLRRKPCPSVGCLGRSYGQALTNSLDSLRRPHAEYCHMGVFIIFDPTSRFQGVAILGAVNDAFHIFSDQVAGLGINADLRRVWRLLHQDDDGHECSPWTWRLSLKNGPGEGSLAS